MIERQRPRHHSQAQAADRGRKHEAVPKDTAPEPGDAERQSEHHADFVDDRIEEQAADRGEERDEDRARDAMDDAQARQTNGQPVDATIPNRVLDHPFPFEGRPIGLLR